MAYDGEGFDPDRTEPIPLVQRRSFTDLVGHLLYIQRRLAVIKERYERRRREWADAFTLEQTARRDYQLAEEELHNMILDREKLNRALVTIYQEMAPHMAAHTLRDAAAELAEEERISAEEERDFDRRWID